MVTLNDNLKWQKEMLFKHEFYFSFLKQKMVKMVKKPCENNK